MKALFFIYGTICYIIFLGVVMYAICFVENLWVPKSIDVGISSNMQEALLINSLLLALFALQHSVMARPGFKKHWIKISPEHIERSTYVLVTNLVLILLFLQWRPINNIVWESQNEMLTAAIWSLYGLGWLIVFLSTFMINHFDLFGLKQVFENLKSIESRPLPFTKGYLYGFIRHPMMLGFIIAFWATPVMRLGHLFFAVMTTAYILIAIKFFEEKDLVKNLGEQYIQYRKEVPMIIPFKSSKR